MISRSVDGHWLYAATNQRRERDVLLLLLLSRFTIDVAVSFEYLRLVFLYLFFFLLLAPIDFGDTTSRIVWWIPAIFDRTAMEMSSDCDCRLLSRYWIPFHPISNANESRFLFSCLFLFPMFFFWLLFTTPRRFLSVATKKKNSFRSCHGAFLLEPMNSSHRHIDASSMPPPKSVRWISLPFASILFLFVCFVCFFFAVLYSFKFWGL